MIDQVYLDIVTLVTRQLDIPVAVKLAPYITNLPRMANKLVNSGAKGLVLFNKLYHPDIDVDKIEARFSNGEMLLRLPKREESKPRSVKIKVEN